MAPPTAAELVERRKKNREMFNKKRGELLDDLLRNLDILIYAELSTIYYMEYINPSNMPLRILLLTALVAAPSSASSSAASSNSSSSPPNPHSSPIAPPTIPS